MPVRAAIIPCLTYDDAIGAVGFLRDAFGFAQHALYQSADRSRVEHAELTLDGNMIMIGSAKANEFGIVTPSQTEGRVTSSLYVVVDDPDAHHLRAAAAGADIIKPPRDQDYGGRSYETRDLEGNVWSFGSYDPWAVKP